MNLERKICKGCTAENMSPWQRVGEMTLWRCLTCGKPELYRSQELRGCVCRNTFYYQKQIVSNMCVAASGSIEWRALAINERKVRLEWCEK